MALVGSRPSISSEYWRTVCLLATSSSPGIGHLNAADQAVFNSLPSRFRFKDASNAMGQSSGSNVVRFLSKCCSLAILRKEGREYEKVAPALERMEGLE